VPPGISSDATGQVLELPARETIRIIASRKRSELPYLKLPRFEYRSTLDFLLGI
jgi:hypothetical protein